MKTRSTQFVGLRSLIFILLSFPIISFSQALPDYKFENPVLESGTDRSVGAVYRFSNIKTGTDGLIKILNMTNGITINNIDRTSDGYKEAFQPEIRLPALRNGYVDFQITFVKTGTNTQQIQPEIKASALDIDGDSGPLFEYNQIDMGGGVVSFNTLGLQILVTPVGTGFRASNITGILFGASVDTTALDVMYTVRNAGISQFTWRTGVDNLLGLGQARRYTSLYFKAFNYNNRVLAVPKVLDFKGNSNGNKVALSWMVEADAGYTCTLEKAGTDGKYNRVEGVIVNNNSYSYSGDLASSEKSLYRVKVIGPEGQVKYSSVIAFQNDKSASKDLKVYPSVVTNKQFVINITTDRQTQGTIQLVNYAGAVVYKKNMSLNAGSNNISVNDFNSTLKGSYIAVATYGDQQYSSKIVLQ